MSKAIGIVLIVLGIIGLAWGGISYTTQKKVVDLGPIQASRTQTHTLPLPPIAGAILLIGGIVVLVTSKD